MRLYTVLGLFLAAAMNGAAMADEARCRDVVKDLRTDVVFGPHAPCAGSRDAFCASLQTLAPERFAALSPLETRPDGPEARRLAAAMAACGLDYDGLRERQCQAAFRREDVGFVLGHCPYEAWSLARAQCERNLDTISPRYYELCKRFGRPLP